VKLNPWRLFGTSFELALVDSNSSLKRAVVLLPVEEMSYGDSGIK
jgi:hypothetical protein